MPVFKRSMLWLTVAALVLAACAPEPTTRPNATLSANSPVAQLREGLTVSARPADLTGSYALELNTLSSEAFNSAAWASARLALPAGAGLAGPVFTLHGQGTAPASLFLSLNVPAGVDGLAVDALAWDGTAWAVLPTQLRANQKVARASALPRALALFAIPPHTPLTALSVQPGQTAPASNVNVMLVDGARANADGSLGGGLASYTLLPGQTAYALVSPNAGVAGVLASPAHPGQLAGLAVGNNFGGVVLNYGPLNPAEGAAFVALVQAATQALREQGKGLWVVVPPLPATGTAAAPNFDPQGYDLFAIGQLADRVLVTWPTNPAALGNGDVEAWLNWLTGQVPRQKLVAVLPTHPTLSRDGLTFEPTDTLTALRLLGEITAERPAEMFPGQAVNFGLSGSAANLAFDPQAAATRLSANGQTVWLPGPATLATQLAWLNRYGLGGMTLADPTSFTAETQATLVTYQTRQLSAPAPGNPPDITWVVSQNNAVVNQATGPTYAFVPDQPGDYMVSVRVLGTDLGGFPVQVNPAPTPTPTAQPTVVANRPPVTGGPTVTPRPSGPIVLPPPIAAGTFELGGQVPGFISHPDLMRRSGMKWVKFQVRSGSGAEFIGAARSYGLKVLLSVMGDVPRATDPAYQDEFARWVAGMAAAGADAIEIWNEPNLAVDWPEGQINGASYTEMLRRAYVAIKAANPGTMVISGAPAPTGAEAAFPGRVVNDDKFLAQMAAAGAANYMDCVGVHYNSGTTSPYANTGSALGGYHYSFHYQPMVEVYWNAFGGTRPLCFTELGYVSPEGYPAPGPNFAWAANTTVSQQAQWLAETVSLAATSGRVRLLIVWNVDFTKYTEYDPQAGYAMLRPNGTCPACDALDAVMP